MSLLMKVSAASAAVLLTLTACGTGGGGESDAIKIGAAVSETGQYSTEAATVKDGYEFWADYVNNELGGIKVGNEKRQVEVIFYDDESNPERAIQLTQRLISKDEVDFVFGPYGSSMTIAVSSITDRSDKILFSGAAGSKSLFTEGRGHIFSPHTLANKYMTSGLELLGKHDAKSVSILQTDTAPMPEIGRSSQATAKKLGMQVKRSVSVPVKSVDIGGAMRRLKASKPDVLVVAAPTSIGVLVTKELKQQNWTPKHVMMMQAPTEPEFVKQLGAKTTQGLMAPNQWDPSVDYQGKHFNAHSYATAFQKKYDYEPTYLAAGSTAVGLTLQAAIEDAGSVQTDDVTKALYKLDLNTFFGPIDYAGPDEGGELVGANPGRSMLTTQLNAKGEQVIVAPEDHRTGELMQMVPWDERR